MSQLRFRDVEVYKYIGLLVAFLAVLKVFLYLNPGTCRKGVKPSLVLKGQNSKRYHLYIFSKNIHFTSQKLYTHRTLHAQLGEMY